jgi:GT2 family glycosyltransferase
VDLINGMAALFHSPARGRLEKLPGNTGFSAAFNAGIATGHKLMA